MISRASNLGIGAQGTTCVLLFVGSGCLEPSYCNRPLRTHDPRGGYRFDALNLGPDNTDEMFVCVTMSGGGMRSAALAYGVLVGLRNTYIPARSPGGPLRRLLHEVDVISAVSGGSFTAAAYGLFRDGLFSPRFKQRFLMHDVEADLWARLFNPIHLVLLPSSLLDRTDIAAAYWDETIFEHCTFADLLERRERPLVVINATDLSRGRRFEFTLYPIVA